MNETLIQTRIPAVIAKTIENKASDEGLSLAAYVRRILIRDGFVPSNPTG